MDKETAKAKIKELTDSLNDHNHKYYVLSKPVISDYEFDMLLEELSQLEKDFPEFASPDSPTKRVGGEITKEFRQVVHTYPMLSLSNTYTEEEIRDFETRIVKIIGSQVDYVCELKYDGVSISLTYLDGKLASAVTRGDGVQGDDVTTNIKTIKSIPLRLKGDYPAEFVIRGEIFMPKEGFAKMNAERIENGEEPFANPRNATSGTIKMQDSAEVAKRNLDGFFYYLPGHEHLFKTHWECLLSAKSWGFKISEFIVKCRNIQEIFDFIGETGLDAIEFWPETPDFWLRGQPIQELHSCFRNHPELSHNTVHTPILDLNPCSINPGVASLSLEHAVESLKMAEAVNAAVFTFHPGRRTAKRVPSAADYKRFDHLIDRMHCASRDSQVRVAIENMEVSVNSLLCTPDGVRELLDNEKWLFFTLDVSHAMGVSLDEVIRYIDLCHDRLVNVHLSRANGASMHLPVEGSPEIVTVLHALADYSFDGNLTLEIEDRNFDHEYSSEEKCHLLMRELAFMKEHIPV